MSSIHGSELPETFPIDAYPLLAMNSVCVFIFNRILNFPRFLLFTWILSNVQVMEHLWNWFAGQICVTCSARSCTEVTWPTTGTDACVAPTWKNCSSPNCSKANCSWRPVSRVHLIGTTSDTIATSTRPCRPNLRTSTVWEKNGLF